ncbi:AraC family transcriptional regulator ligand-binding domain-containing protein [Pseudomonas sp. NPDC007930]|uniref:AraC family transcriptional regulator n=1 Tax=Pseudomonas sp. NPDC007930 TaxID=3364417 RepID=UPI0036F0462F
MVAKDTISLHLLHEALRQSVPAEHWPRWLAAAGIAAGAERVAVAQYAEVWQALAGQLDDEFFGMDPRPLRRGSLAFLCRAGLGQPTVRAALAQGCSFLALMLQRLAPALEQQGPLAALVLQPAGAPPRAFACFTLWLLLYGALCWWAGQRVPVLAVELQGPAPDYLEDYQRLFGPHLRFGQPRNRLLFPSACLALPVRRSEAELAAFLAQAPGNLLVKYRDPGNLVYQVRARLQQLAPAQWPSAEAVAQALGVSAATLRRRLAEQGESFQALRASERQSRALALLAEPGLALEQVAERLGFADARSFHKAFRAWFGTSPGQYRRAGQTAQGG